MNKCFIILKTSTIYSRREEGRVDTLVDYSVCDILENNCFANYSAYSEGQNVLNNFDCYVADKKCKTEKEWLNLVKPYLQK
jgi:hypothetical protein